MASVGDQQQPAFAIIGYAARFPGAANAEEFWDVLREGRDAISEVPKDRWDVDEFFDPEAGVPGKVVTRRAGFVDDATGFDAPFFGVSTREARLMDPQHRLLLETAWRAVEHSGTAPTATTQASGSSMRDSRAVHPHFVQGTLPKNRSHRPKTPTWS